MLPTIQWLNRLDRYATAEELHQAAAASTKSYPARLGQVEKLVVEKNVWGLALVRQSDGVGVGFWRDPAWKLPNRSGKRKGKNGTGKWVGNQHLFGRLK